MLGRCDYHVHWRWKGDAESVTTLRLLFWDFGAAIPCHDTIYMGMFKNLKALQKISPI
jgi:hypothetical protein